MNYNIKDLETSKSVDDAKLIYRSLVKLFHPDTGGTEEAFKNLNNVYHTLIKKLPEHSLEQKKKPDINHTYFRILDYYPIDQSFHTDLPFDEINEKVILHGMAKTQEFRLEIPIGTKLPWRTIVHLPKDDLYLLIKRGD